MLQGRRLIQAGCRLVRRYCTESYPSMERGMEEGAKFSDNHVVNQVTLIGRVGKEPFITDSPTGKYAVFTVGTQNVIRRQDGSINEKTEWHRIWTNRRVLVDNVVPRINVGDKVYVFGRLQYIFMVSKTGEPHKVASINVERLMVMLKADEEHEQSQIKDSEESKQTDHEPGIYL